MTDATNDKQPGETTTEPRPQITTLVVGTIDANCYLVTCPRTRVTLIVDPGAKGERILAQVAKLGGAVAGILHTHGHFDHISATEEVLAGLPEPVRVWAHPADAYLYEPAQRAMGAAFGYPLPATPAMPDVPLVEGDTVEVGDLRLRVIETPGHTPGSVSLVCGDVCLSGDTLFRRGIGRTDLLGGDEEAIYESIMSRLYTLPGETRVYPGHGEPTTIDEERRANPFVRG